MKNEKIALFFIKRMACIAVFALAMLFAGCATTGFQGKDSELIAANARNIGRIESTVEALDGTISDSRERLEIVGRAGQKIRDAGERLDFLLGEYESEVERILNEVDNLRARLQEVDESSSSGMGNPDQPYSGIYNKKTGLPCEILIDRTTEGTVPEATDLISCRGGEAYGYTSGYA